jgi:hypothetical protein
MDYKKLFYGDSKRKFLNDITNTVCKEVEEPETCISKNMKSFDLIFDTLSEQLTLEDGLLNTFKVREKEGANFMRQMPFLEKHRQFRFYDYNY